jgi:hypothetical protein
MPKNIMIHSWLTVIYCDLECFHLTLRNKTPETKIKEKFSSFYIKPAILVTVLKIPPACKIILYWNSPVRDRQLYKVFTWKNFTRFWKKQWINCNTVWEAKVGRPFYEAKVGRSWYEPRVSRPWYEDRLGTPFYEAKVDRPWYEATVVGHNMRIQWAGLDMRVRWAGHFMRLRWADHDMSLGWASHDMRIGWARHFMRLRWYEAKVGRPWCESGKMIVYFLFYLLSCDSFLTWLLAHVTPDSVTVHNS